MGLSLLVSIVETAGVSVIMPFIAVASDFKLVETNDYYKWAYEFFNFSDSTSFVISFGLVLLCFYIFRSGVNLFYFYMLGRFTQGRNHLLGVRLFDNYMHLSYRNFVDKNSSEVTKTIITEAHFLVSVLQAVLFIFTEILVVVFIYSMMLYANVKITISLTAALATVAILLVKFFAKKVKAEGIKREKYQKYFYEVIHSTLGNFKLIKLQAHNKKVLEKFSSASHGYAESNIAAGLIGHIPRLLLESIAFGLVIVTVVFIVWRFKSEIVSFLPIISMFVLGLYRLMPSINRIISSYNSILYNLRAVDIIYDNLNMERENLSDEEVSFDGKISLKGVSFSYKPEQNILKDVNLVINKGDKVAFIGKSGGGKSTLVDIIIGLFRPEKGQIYVDDKELSDSNIKKYREKVGYIPQSVYLFDGTVAENVAFEFEYDESKVREVLQKANILEFLEESPDGIHTNVGEGGICLSGGQKQRIAIARALYNDPEILVLDEATSALDKDTESRIMNEIYTVSEDKTLIVIAHRLSTLQRCEKVYEIRNGIVSKVENPNERTPHDL